MEHDKLSRRSGGVLLHLTSLPGPHAIGDMGPAAYRWVDQLKRAGQSWWQTLPVHPVGPGNSPYSAISLFAGEPLLISLEKLVDAGLLSRDDVPAASHSERTNYATARVLKFPALRRAFKAFRPSSAYKKFCARQKHWLDDFARFQALRRKHEDRVWTDWPSEDIDEREVAFERFLQFVFDHQWTELRRYCAESGIGLLGDMPFYAAHDSADVWAHRDLFFLDQRGRPSRIAGVPPDMFSATGQLWGHPHYNWKPRTSEWWVARLKMALERFDAVRIDHFIGFVRGWHVKAGASDARVGTWRPGPGGALLKRFGRCPLFAEDLGTVTPEVRKLRDAFGLPGMKVLQFGFGEPHGTNEHLPHNYGPRFIAYTGTHDNDMLRGWFESLPPGDRRFVLEYSGSSGQEIHWDLIRLTWMSVATIAIAPAQDLLGLGTAARMNFPGRPDGNWEWRLPNLELSQPMERLHGMTRAYGRV